MNTATADVLEAVGHIASAWRGDRRERQSRRHLEAADFDTLRDAGLLAMIAPAEAGGLWQSTGESIRPLCEAYRVLAAADPSVALVSSMHPAVVSYWLANPDPSQAEWEDQRRAVFASAVAGEQWGTITSEPGSGGDIMKTRARAAPLDAEAFLPGAVYGVTGDKHFGSGMGIADRMMTTAIPEGEPDPTIFVLDTRGRPWDGTAGLRLAAEWDGMGMAATQSHAMRLDAAPAVRLAWKGDLTSVTIGAAPLVASLFTSVILGVLDEAIAVARSQVRDRAEQLRAYEQVEWSRAEQEHWLAVQAYEGALRAVEAGSPEAARHGALRAKQAVADLAEQALLRCTRVLGGGTFSRRSPFAHWFEDVRALGFLRPPWGLAYDMLFATSLG
jgi:alkylation response protein AidB-like acyl-CoA dehydrogenase